MVLSLYICFHGSMNEKKQQQSHKAVRCFKFHIDRFLNMFVNETMFSVYAVLSCF